MIVLDPSIYWQGVCKHLVVNAPSVRIVRCSKNLVDASEKNIQQRAKSLSLAGASVQDKSHKTESLSCVVYFDPVLKVETRELLEVTGLAG